MACKLIFYIICMMIKYDRSSHKGYIFNENGQQIMPHREKLIKYINIKTNINHLLLIFDIYQEYI